MSWDEQPDPELDGQAGDLITWDEVDAEEVSEPEHFAPVRGTPHKSAAIVTATPALAERVSRSTRS